jgi:MSHA biogenesis protein MshL
MNKPSKRLLPLLLVAMTILTVGCESTPPRDGGTLGTIQDSLKPAGEAQTAPRSVTPPASVSNALLPPVDLSLPELDERGKEARFDVNVTDVPTPEFLMSLVDGTPYNMVVHPAVEGSISLSLKNVTIPEVMEVLRDVHGYEFQRSRSGYQVLPVRLRSRVFQVNYLNMRRSGISQTRVSSGQVSDSVNGQGEGREQSGMSGDKTSGAQITTKTETDFWSDLSRALNAIVGEGDGRTVVVTPHSGIVVVRAMPQELREVERYLQTTEGVMHRQVILEAKIIEVQLKDGYQAGIDWAAVINVGGGQFNLGQAAGGNGIFGDPDNTRVDIPSGGIGNPSGPSPVDFVDFQSFGSFFGGTFSSDNFAAFVQLLELQGNVQVLSSPRVATVNNQKAVIKVGTDEFFVTDVSSESSTESNTIGNDIELTPFFSGIALDVTPQIGADGHVTLHIHPSISSVEDQEKVINVGDQFSGPVVLPLAKSTVRESDSIVYARSGQLVVIGGLMQDNTGESLASTPILGELPGVGQLFRYTRQAALKSELVILLRPTVVNSPAVWNRDLNGASRRVQRLDRGFHYGPKPEIFGNLGEKPLSF